MIDLSARVAEEFDCEHASQVLTVKECADGRPMYRRQCLRCGQATTGAIAKASLSEPQRAAAVPFDDDLKRLWWERRAARYDELRQAARADELEDWRRDADAYKRSARWQLLRSKVLKRAANVCEGCGDRRAVEVHHLTYERWRREMLFDLVALCSACHGSIHGLDREGVA
jgi:hypothetical protein